MAGANKVIQFSLLLSLLIVLIDIESTEAIRWPKKEKQLTNEIDEISSPMTDEQIRDAVFEDQIKKDFAQIDESKEKLVIQNLLKQTPIITQYTYPIQLINQSTSAIKNCQYIATYDEVKKQIVSVIYNVC